MSGNKYFIKRSFIVPSGEVSRDYRPISKSPANFLFPCDYRVDDDEDFIVPK